MTCSSSTSTGWAELEDQVLKHINIGHCTAKIHCTTKTLKVQYTKNSLPYNFIKQSTFLLYCTVYSINKTHKTLKHTQFGVKH